MAAPDSFNLNLFSLTAVIVAYTLASVTANWHIHEPDIALHLQLNRL